MFLSETVPASVTALAKKQADDLKKQRDADAKKALARKKALAQKNADSGMDFNDYLVMGAIGIIIIGFFAKGDKNAA